MVTTLSLYRLAEKEGIPVENQTLIANKSFSLSLGSAFSCISIDPNRFDSDKELKVCLAHELGHCTTGSFYNNYSEFDIIEKHEQRADRWAIKKLVPRNKLKQAFSSGYTEIWDLAEYFDVTEDFIVKAIEYYKVCA